MVPLLVIAGSCSKKTWRPHDTAIYHYNRGVTFLEQEDYRNATFEFKTAIEIDPKYAEAHNGLGLVYRYTGHTDLAIASFKHAVAANPKYAAPYMHLGVTYLDRNDYDRAVSYLEQAIKHDKSFADAYYNLGLAYYDKHQTAPAKGLLKRARNNFIKATDISTALWEAHALLGMVYEELGDWEKALIRYNLSLEVEPRQPDTWEKLALLYERLGEHEKAELCFSKSASLKNEFRSPPER